LAEGGVGEQVVSAFGEWAPGLDLDTAFAHTAEPDSPAAEALRFLASWAAKQAEVTAERTNAL
jgi:hypothetical protein